MYQMAISLRSIATGDPNGSAEADDGQQFGWGEEQGLLGHTEIFCRYNPYEEKSSKAVQEWLEKIGQRPIESLFAVPSFFPVEKTGPHVSNYPIWYGKLKQAFDPDGIGEHTGFSYVGADTGGVHTTIYKNQPE